MMEQLIQSRRHVNGGREGGFSDRKRIVARLSDLCTVARMCRKDGIYLNSGVVDCLVNGHPQRPFLSGKRHMA
jgi:hypothetical protein